MRNAPARCLASLTWALLLLVLTLGAVAQDTASPSQGTVTTIIPIGEAPLNQVVEAVPQVLSASGKMKLVDKGRAIQVTDQPEYIDAARSIVQELGRPRPVGPNVRISVQFLSLGDFASRGAGVSGSYQRGQVPRRQNGRIVVEPIERGSVNVGLGSRQTSRSSNINQFLVVGSGHWGSIEVGRDVPYVTYFYDYGIAAGIVPAGAIQWQRVGTRLSVRPTVLPNGQINVSVAPEISALVGNGRWQSYRIDTLATTVTVANGGTVTLGGFSDATSEFNSYFFGFGERSASSSATFKLTATVVSPSGQPVGTRQTPAPVREPSYEPLIRR